MEIGKKYMEDYGWYFDYLRKTTEKRDVVVYLKQLVRELTLHFKQVSNTIQITCVGGGSGDADVEIIDEFHARGFETSITYVDPSEVMFKLFLARLIDKGFEDSLQKVVIKPFEKTHLLPKSDMLLCLNAIYYMNGIEDPKRAKKILKKMYNNLKPGGVGVIVVQSRRSPHYILRKKARRLAGKTSNEIDGKYLFDLLTSMSIRVMMDTIESKLDITRIFRKGKVYLDEINKNILSLALRQDWEDIPKTKRRAILSDIEEMSISEGNKRYINLLYDVLVFYKPIKGYQIPHDPFEEIDVVDEKDRIIGKTTRFIAHMKGILHREVGILLFSKSGKLIVGIRASDGRFDFSASGHVPAGYDPAETIVSECKEELGLSMDEDDLKFVFKKELVSVSPPKTNRRIFYLYVYPKPVDPRKFKLGPEVAGVKEVALNEISSLIDENPDRFSKGFAAAIKYYLTMLGGNGETILVKIGGSVINPKSTKSKRLNKGLLKKIGKTIKKYWPYKNFILVLGGGYIGHTLTLEAKRKSDRVKFSRNYQAYEEKVVNRVADLFYDLGLPVYRIRYSAMYFDSVNGKEIGRSVEEALAHGFIPLLYADWVKTAKGMKVLSSDEIMKHVSRNVPVSKAVFLTDVDGVYDKNGKVIARISRRKLKNLDVGTVKDATGGMKKKLIEISGMPVDVFVVNGYYPDRLEDIVNGRKTIGTHITPN